MSEIKEKKSLMDGKINSMIAIRNAINSTPLYLKEISDLIAITVDESSKTPESTFLPNGQYIGATVRVYIPINVINL